MTMSLYDIDELVGKTMTDAEFADWVKLSREPYEKAVREFERARAQKNRVIDILLKCTGKNFDDLLQFCKDRRDKQ